MNLRLVLEEEASKMRYRTVTVDVRFTYTVDEEVVREAYGVGDLDVLTEADVARHDSATSILEFVDEVEIVDGSWKLSPICEPEGFRSSTGDSKILPFPSKH